MSLPKSISPHRATDAETSPRRVAIVGGGLAGLAAAVALAEQSIDERPVTVELFEARRRLGGRAASFADAATGEAVDYCQHISMGCCTNLADFCQRTGTEDLFRPDRVLNLFTRDGRCSRLAARLVACSVAPSAGASKAAFPFLGRASGDRPGDAAIGPRKTGRTGKADRYRLVD